jgi:hypothetical protein
MLYKVNGNNTFSKSGALLDGRDNGGVSGSDVKVIEISYCRADITGIGDQTIHGSPHCSGSCEDTDKIRLHH